MKYFNDKTELSNKYLQQNYHSYFKLFLINFDGPTNRSFSNCAKMLNVSNKRLILAPTSVAVR